MSIITIELDEVKKEDEVASLLHFAMQEQPGSMSTIQGVRRSFTIWADEREFEVPRDAYIERTNGVRVIHWKRDEAIEAPVEGYVTSVVATTKTKIPVLDITAIRVEC